MARECEERDRHAINNRIRDAQLPRMKTLEEFDCAQAPQLPAAKIRDLAEGGYIERSEPVLLIGECAFITAAALVNELVEARQNPDGMQSPRNDEELRNRLAMRGVMLGSCSERTLFYPFVF